MNKQLVMVINEYDIIFYGYPCPAGPDESWITHKEMIIFLNNDEFVYSKNKIESVND